MRYGRNVNPIFSNFRFNSITGRWLLARRKLDSSRLASLPFRRASSAPPQYPRSASPPKVRVSIASLNYFFGRLLYDRIRGEFSALTQDIRNLVVHSCAELDALSAPRRTTVQQRQPLSLDTAARYQETVNNGLRGDYTPE